MKQSPRMQVPFSLPSVSDEDVASVVRVLRSGWITTGPECAEFERELAAYLGIAHTVAVASCTHALEICLHYLGLPRGSRVAVPVWTFVSTALAVMHAGYTPVLVDVERDTLNMSLKALEPVLDRVRAVIPVHFGGVPVDEDIFAMAQERNLPVIEDAAHALGAYSSVGPLNGAGSNGACFSFYATKNLSSAEGGAIATADADLAAFARSFRLHGFSADAWKRYAPDGASNYDLLGAGLKANMPDVLAALARSQLTRFEAMQERRSQLVRRYRQSLEQVSGLELIPHEPLVGVANHLLVVSLLDATDRDGLLRLLAERGVGTSVHFKPLHRFKWLREQLELGLRAFPVAEALEHSVISLPLYPDLTFQQVDYTCEVLADVLEHK